MTVRWRGGAQNPNVQQSVRGDVYVSEPSTAAGVLTPQPVPAV
jgi:hypothetical protein